MAKSGKLLYPRVPALFFKPGKRMSRRQPDGALERFEVQLVRSTYTDVPSKLDGFASDWYADRKQWIRLEATVVI